MDFARAMHQNRPMPRNRPAPPVNAVTAASVATVLIAVMIAAATLMPARMQGGVPGSDKLHHLVAFAALIFPLACVRPRWIVRLSLVLAVYGGLIEVIQPYVGRGRELADWVADLAGIAIGAAAALGVNRAWHRLRRQNGTAADPSARGYDI